MSIYLHNSKSIFSIYNSDKIGSYIIKDEIKEIIPNADLTVLKFEKINNIDVINETILQKYWYSIRDSKNKSSLDELILKAIINKTLVCNVESQLNIKRFAIDLVVTYNNITKYIEFDGPTHYIISKYGIPKDPFYKKKTIEDLTGIEVIKWPYWIQRCQTNVNCIFNTDNIGLGALWSTKIHFSDFYFDNSAEIIDKITNRFNANTNGYGYFYTRDIQHPIINKIINNKASSNVLIPKGTTNYNKWLPDVIKI